MNENVYPAALIARTAPPSPFPSCCRLPRRFMLQFSSEPVGSVSKPTVPLRSPPHRHPLAVPRVHRRANRRGVQCRVDFFISYHRMFDRMPRSLECSIKCSQAPHTSAHTQTYAFSNLQPDPCADAIADPCADPITDPLTDPKANPLTDPKANPIADPTAEARQAALCSAVQGQQLLQGQNGGSDECRQHTEGLPIQRPESGL